MKILQFTTYSLEQLDHGGKLRSYHIRECLRKRYDVETLSFEWGHQNNAENLSVILDQSSWPDFSLKGLLVDWGVSTYIEQKSNLYRKIEANVKAYRPDILFLEQPFLWPLAKKLIKSEAKSSNV